MFMNIIFIYMYNVKINITKGKLTITASETIVRASVVFLCSVFMLLKLIFQRFIWSKNWKPKDHLQASKITNKAKNNNS